MPDSVIDASALCAVVFGEPEGRGVVDEIDGLRLHAPALLPFEVMNAGWKKARTDARAAARVADAGDLVRRMELKFRTVDHRAVLRLAVDTGLTAYDASYVWLARSLQLPLITLDRRQRRVFDGEE